MHATCYPRADVAWQGDDRTGECPVWDVSSRVVRWVDIEGRRLHSLDPVTGKHHMHPTPARIGCFTTSTDGRLLVAMEHAFAWMSTEAQDVTILVEPEKTRSGNRFNDGCCDRQGRFLAGSMNLNKDAASGSLWRIGSELRAHEVASGVTVANGLAFSPDGATMWWADSPRERVFKFDYDTATGEVSNQRVWLDRGHAPGRPDGGTVDADGCYWSARWRGGCVVRFTPDGRLDRTITLPVEQVTMCAFGGERLDTLYVTSARNSLDAGALASQPLAGSLFALQPGVCGMAPTPFIVSSKDALAQGHAKEEA